MEGSTLPMCVGLTFCLQSGLWRIWFQIAQKHFKKSGVTPNHLHYNARCNDITSCDAIFGTAHKYYKGAQEVQMHMTQKVGPELRSIEKEIHIITPGTVHSQGINLYIVSLTKCLASKDTFHISKVCF